MQLSIVVPCFNEEEVLHETSRRLVALLQHLREQGRIADSSAVHFVDDGSRDRTWEIMVDHYLEGAEVVYGVRERRDSDTPFKRWSAQTYYRLLHFLGARIVYNHADYRLLSRRTLECLREFREVNLFLLGIIPLLGFRTATVTYARTSRFAGGAKFPVRKMRTLATDGVTSLSAVPLRLITLTGIVVFLGSMGVAGWAFWVRLIGDTAVPGWASTVIPFYFLGGVQLSCIGVIGENLAKIFDEVKGRPRHFIETTV